MRQPEVDAWFERYENPMKPVVLAVRDAILAADERLDECIKWQAPTFVYKGNLATFYPKSRQHASLMFHTGAKIAGDFPSFEGTGDIGRVMKFFSLDDVAAKVPELQRIVASWIDSRS